VLVDNPPRPGRLTGDFDHELVRTPPRGPVTSLLRGLPKNLTKMERGRDAVDADPILGMTDLTVCAGVGARYLKSGLGFGRAFALRSLSSEGMEGGSSCYASDPWTPNTRSGQQDLLNAASAWAKLAARCLTLPQAGRRRLRGQFQGCRARP